VVNRSSWAGQRGPFPVSRFAAAVPAWTAITIRKRVHPE